MNGDSAGQIVTFYSFKGGTGRSMALANVAWILAANGNRVLAVDWDLEAPGLDRFFQPFLPPGARGSTEGVIDLIRAYEDEAKKSRLTGPVEGLSPAQAPAEHDQRPEEWFREMARTEPYAFSLQWDHFPPGGALDLVPAGRQNGDYSATVAGLDWETFYRRLDGGRFLAVLRQQLKERYDFVLVDSRTGYSDVVDICTRHLPDTLVSCFTYSDQGIEGAAKVASKLVSEVIAERPRILPIPMRVDQRAEQEKLDAGRALARRSFAALPSQLSEDERDAYWRGVEIPYVTYYAYEETLATFGESPGVPSSLLSAYERLTAAITGNQVKRLPKMDEATRLHWKEEFKRRVSLPTTKVALQYPAEDQVWAEWIGQVLRTASVKVLDPGPLGPASPPLDDPDLRVLSIVSAHEAALVAHTQEHSDRWKQAPLGVFLGDARPRELDFGSAAVSLAGLSSDEAARKILCLVGHESHPGARQAGSDLRYPGQEPIWYKLAGRDVRFTGRIDDIQRLRNELLKGGTAVALVALQGIGGIGKSMLALEYAHRFRAAYDLVWWVTSQPARFVDAHLAELAQTLDVSTSQDTMEGTRALREALRQGRPTDRWLIVFDNAENVDHVKDLLPTGRGHVIVTSRNSAWEEHANAIPVTVFTRNESISHLQNRVPWLSDKDANSVAEVLGDLPIAVNTAAALLAETGESVNAYVDRIARSTATEPWNRVWAPSLDRLSHHAPAAYKLLQICSMMAADIALDLVYGDSMAEALIPLDPGLSDRVMRGTLTRQIGRLGLMQLDAQGRRVHVHRLIQAAVRDRMTADEMSVNRHIAHMVLAAARPQAEVDDPPAWPNYQLLWPHLEISDAAACPEFVVRQLFIDRVRYLWRRGDLDRGRDLGREVVANWQRRLTGLRADPEMSAEADSLETQLLHLSFNLANILRDQARYREALEIDERVLARQRELLGPVHSNTLMTAGGHAADLRAVGRYDDALALEESTSAAWSEALGQENPRALAAANNLAVSYRVVGRFNEARRLDEKVLGMRKRLLGETHPLTLHSASSLGRDLREAGDYGESVDLLSSVQKDFEATAGSREQGRLSATANLAVSLRSAGRPSEATHLLDSAYESLRLRFGGQSPYTLACRLNRAVNMLAVDDAQEAIAELTATAGEYEGTLGRQHPMTLVCLNDLSAAFRASGNVDRAMELVEEAVLGCTEGLGPRHPFTLAVRQNRATCRHDVGDAARAVEECVEVAAMMATALGDEHPDTLVCRLSHGVMVSGAEGLRRGSGAEDLVLLVERLGEGHPTVAQLQAGGLVYRLLDPSDPF